MNQHGALSFIQLSDNSVCASSIGRKVDFPGRGLILGKAGIWKQKRAEAEGEDGIKEGHPFHGNPFLKEGFEVMLPE